MTLNKEHIIDLLSSNNEDDVKLGCIILIKSAANQEEIKCIMGDFVALNLRYSHYPAILYKYNKNELYFGISNVMPSVPHGINSDVLQTINLDEE